MLWVDWQKIEKLSLISSYKPDLDRLMKLDGSENEFDELEYSVILDKLLDNSIDPITSGMNYNQTDIRKHLKKLR